MPSRTTAANNPFAVIFRHYKKRTCRKKHARFSFTVLKDAPTKLKVSVNVADSDWRKIQDLFDQEHKWMLAKMQEHIREVNGMFVEERRRVQKHYKEYDGCYLGYYAQWFFWLFFTIGISVVTWGIAILIARVL